MRLPVLSAAAARAFAGASSHLAPRAAIWVGCGIVLVSVLGGCDRAEDARQAVKQAASSASDKVRSAVNPGPTGAIEQMLARARSGDWEGYLEYYGEKDKLRNEEDRRELAYRFRSQWGHRVIANLERAEAINPTIVGDRAIFRDERGEAFVLYRGEDGRWGFHL